MSKVVQISILGRISGNVNADEVIGTRITLKRMYSSGGEVLPFVSARAVKYAIRQALKEKGFDIDPFIENPQATEALRLRDSGDPVKYVDNDLFGYMVTRGRGEIARRRQAPIALSYFKALKDTPIKAEFAARFPREAKGEKNPVPFEVEVAEFIGRLNCIIYENVGIFKEDEIEDEKEKEVMEKIKKYLDGKMLEKKEVKIKVNENEITKNIYLLPSNERERRLKAFSETLLTPSYVLPRRTNSLNIPEYFAALIALSKEGPLPIFQYLDYDFGNGKVDTEKLKMLIEREEIRTKLDNNNVKFLLVDYLNIIKTEELQIAKEKTEGQQKTEIVKVSVSKAIDEIAHFIMTGEFLSSEEQE